MRGAGTTFGSAAAGRTGSAAGGTASRVPAVAAAPAAGIASVAPGAPPEAPTSPASPVTPETMASLPVPPASVSAPIPPASSAAAGCTAGSSESGLVSGAAGGASEIGAFAAAVGSISFIGKKRSSIVSSYGNSDSLLSFVKIRICSCMILASLLLFFSRLCRASSICLFFSANCPLSTGKEATAISKSLQNASQDCRSGKCLFSSPYSSVWTNARQFRSPARAESPRDNVPFDSCTEDGPAICKTPTPGSGCFPRARRVLGTATSSCARESRALWCVRSNRGRALCCCSRTSSLAAVHASAIRFFVRASLAA